MGVSDSSKPDVEKMKIEKHVEGLIKALKDEGDWKIRWRAARALGKIGDQRALELLMKARQYTDRYTREAVKEALEKIRMNKT